MSNSCIDFPVVSSAPAGMRFGFPGEDDTGGEARLFTSAFPVSISTTSLFSAGDSLGIGNGTRIEIDDSTQETTIKDVLGDMLLLDRANELYQIGDISNVSGNGTRIQIEANNAQMRVIDSLGDTLSLDRINGDYRLGDSTSSVNGTEVRVRDSTQEIMLQDITGMGLHLDFGNLLYKFGDIDDVGFGSKIIVSNANADIRLLSDDGIRTTIPGGPTNTPGERWMLGAVVTATVVLDTTQYVDVQIGGVDLKLALVV